MGATHRLSRLRGNALILTNGGLRTSDAKVAHGLIRESNRFKILGIVDSAFAGRDAGELLDGRKRGIPVYVDMDAALAAVGIPDVAIIGVAVSGGRLPDTWINLLLDVVNRGISVVNSMHQRLSAHPEISAAAARSGAEIFDVRRPRNQEELHFWSGRIFDVETPRIAVLGTDCALGKRTTCRLILELCRQSGLAAEMIYTGQTGWMQGSEYGFILDATLNDYVSGELEWAILECQQNASPDLMLIEGQSGLRNPSGPCGSELIISADARGVILQHAPFRIHYEDQAHIGTRLPDLESEIELIRLYGADVLAVTLNRTGGTKHELKAVQRGLEKTLGLPVLDPLDAGRLQRLLPVIEKFRRDYPQLGPVTRRDRPSSGGTR